MADFEPGDINDSVQLVIDGKEIKIAESYEVSIRVLQQPAAFTLRMGWGGTVADLREQFGPGQKFQLYVGGARVQSGRIDAVNAPDGKTAQIEIKGRDWTSVLFKSAIVDEVSFSERTFLDVTKRVLKICGLEDHPIFGNNDALREMQTHAVTRIVSTPNASDQVANQETGLTEIGTIQSVTVQTLVAKVGETWWQWLQRQYKLAGIYLWCAADGSFVISSPDPNQGTSYIIRVKRDQTKLDTTVLSGQLTNDTTNRYSLYVCHGRYGAGQAGRSKYTGRFPDDEMIGLGFPETEAWVIYDNDVKSNKQAEYRARRECAEHRRAGWNLHYTLAGHVVPAKFQKSDLTNWGPDLIAEVYDDDRGIYENMYIEAVTFARSMEGTTTRVELMRLQDMQWLAEDLSELRKKDKKVLSGGSPLPRRGH